MRQKKTVAAFRWDLVYTGNGVLAKKQNEKKFFLRKIFLMRGKNRTGKKEYFSVERGFYILKHVFIL